MSVEENKLLVHCVEQASDARSGWSLDSDGAIGI